MTITTRACANCASFNATPAANEPLCWNLIAIDHADVAAGGVCDQHLSPEEDAEETAMVGAYQRMGCDWMVPDYLASTASARSAIRSAQQQS